MKTKLTMTLPNVGDRLMRVMQATTWDMLDSYVPEPCEVVYVNKDHGWFEVIFLNSGIREGCKLPVFDHSILTGMDSKRHSTPVICVETGDVYPTLEQCADDLGIWHSGISKQLRGEASHCGGYHFCTVL